jgi:hypothetical protein
MIDPRDLARILVAAVGVERARALLDECGERRDTAAPKPEPTEDDMRRAERMLVRRGAKVA